MTDWWQTGSAVASAVAAVAALGVSWWAGRAATAQARAAREQNALERARRHDELRPRFAVVLRPSSPVPVEAQDMVRARRDAPSSAVLTVRLVGPPAVGRLDGLVVRVRNDKRRPVDAYRSGDWTQEECDAHVWSPFRFEPGLDGAVEEHGREVDALAVDPGPLLAGDFRTLTMRRGTAPKHFDADRSKWWTDQEPVDKPVKLELVARLDGYEPWTVLCPVVYDDGPDPAEILSA